MSARSAISLLSLIVAVSLIGAPLTMQDWGEQYEITATQVENMSSVDKESPVYQFESLSPDMKVLVEEAIHTGGARIYGTEDLPDGYSFTSVYSPGAGRYIVVYEGDKYRVFTGEGTGLSSSPALRILLQFPFVGYGLFLFYIRRQAKREEMSTKKSAGFIGVGAAFHLLGPEFDFWVFTAVEYSVIGALAFLGISLWSIRDAL